MAPKKVTTRATSSLDEATRAALAEKKGKAVLIDNTLPAAAETDRPEVVNNRHPHIEDPTPEGSIHTCNSKDLLAMAYHLGSHQWDPTQSKRTKTTCKREKT
jgi:hypothetical protein